MHIHRPVPPPDPRRRPLVSLMGLAVMTLALAACGGGSAPATPPITPGVSAAPREVNIVMRDYAYVPSVVDLVPGETVTLHVVNGGLEIHEAILGDMDAQLAWEAAEGATVDHPPGPTPVVPDPPGFVGTRVVVGSGQRVDVTWTVPLDAAAATSGWFVGCHIPGHWAKGMVVPVRFVGAGGTPLGTPPPLPFPSVG
ncbi:MAG: hypothetical protein ABIR11_11745 [Candidatus Limnocylindrales bacterium]